MSKDVTLVKSDDWVALYIDAKLVMEGHSLLLSDVIEAINGGLIVHYLDEAYAEQLGNMPANFFDIDQWKIIRSYGSLQKGKS